MIAVFAAVKDDDGVVRAERFLCTEEEADELRASSGAYARPWTWVVAVSSFATDAYEGNHHYARWWWDEWERRSRGEPKQVYAPDAHTWHRCSTPRCPWCDRKQDVSDDTDSGHPQEEIATCWNCQQTFALYRQFVYTTKPVRKE